MNKIRILFILITFLVVAGGVVFLSTFQSPMNPEIERISEFKITKISGHGVVYRDKKLIFGTQFSGARPLDIKTMSHGEEMFLKADPQTSFEFYCFGAAFIALPNSLLYYQPRTKEMCFYNGTYFWDKEVRGKKFEAQIKLEPFEGAPEIPEMMAVMSDTGKLMITENTVQIWNYAGKLQFGFDNQSYDLKSGQMLSLVFKRRPEIGIVDLMPAPEFIAPENKIITVKTPQDSIVNFSWKAVRGVKNYFMRLYSTDLKENVLEEWVLAATSKTVNLQKYQDSREFYWQVFPLDEESGKEGVPSKTGYVKLVGGLQDKELVLQPPRLVITSLTVSGNMVLIKGEADVNSQLFINSKPVSIGLDGTFIDTLNFKEMGNHTITFRLVAPTDLETVLTRQVTIFDE